MADEPGDWTEAVGNSDGLGWEWQSVGSLQ